MRVQLSSYVNPKGGKGKNKAADMEKENEVRVLKDLIRGLGANEIEHAILTITKAAPVISEIAANFGSSLKIKERGTSHKKRDDKGDLITLVNALKQKNIWNHVPGRELSNNVSETPFKFDKNMFKHSVLTTANLWMTNSDVLSPYMYLTVELFCTCVPIHYTCTCRYFDFEKVIIV